MRPRIPAPVALLSLLALPVVFVAGGLAQIRGVTNSSSAGQASASTSVMQNSSGSHGAATDFKSNTPSQASDTWRADFSRHHGRDSIGEVFYAVPIPSSGYADAAENDAQTEDSDADYQGGPTIFDRRGSGADSYVPPVRKVPTPHAGVANAALSVPDVPQEPTLLIFRDGHKLEVENYAIVGPTLVDLTPGHERAVALADLDLGATRQQNDNRGIVFHGPQQVPRAN